MVKLIISQIFFVDISLSTIKVKFSTYFILGYQRIHSDE